MYIEGRKIWLKFSVALLSLEPCGIDYRVESISWVLRAAARHWIQIFATLTLLVLSVRIRVTDAATSGGSAARHDESDVTVHVSNHVSWIDILVFTVLLKPSFVAASFVQRVPG